MNSSDDDKTQEVESLGMRYWDVEHAEGAEQVKARHEANRLAWNEGAAMYTDELSESIDFLQAGGSNLHSVERENLGELRSWCETAIHLQCASGHDTLSLWNEGVRNVVGIDISDVHIENARRKSQVLGAPARWFRCDIADAPHELDESADLVYTGRGALCWLHDIDAWARVVHRLLKPGAILHVFDDHPVTWLFDMDSEDLTGSGIDYFGHSESSRGWPCTYIGNLDKDLEAHSVKFERLWNLAEIFQALVRAGLTVEHVGEHREPYWECFPNLKPGLARKIPMTFSMIARKTS